jgi:uroporphyrin-III C-methyltransferase
MLFGRAHEEIEFLVGKGVAVQVVPGVTAAFAASADLGVSLTQRGKARSVAFVTPRVGKGMPESSWIRAALAADTVAIYMGAGEAEVIAKALLAAGKPASTPVAIVENASTPELRIDCATLAGLARLKPGSGPALILLGEVYADAVEAAGRLARSASHAA